MAVLAGPIAGIHLRSETRLAPATIGIEGLSLRPRRVDNPYFLACCRFDQ